jgi:hypothetical protein
MGNPKQAFEYASSATELLGHQEVQQKVRCSSPWPNDLLALTMFPLGLGDLDVEILLQQGTFPLSTCYCPECCCHGPLLCLGQQALQQKPARRCPPVDPAGPILFAHHPHPSILTMTALLVCLRAWPPWNTTRAATSIRSTKRELTSLWPCVTRECNSAIAIASERCITCVLLSRALKQLAQASQAIEQSLSVRVKACNEWLVLPRCFMCSPRARRSKSLPRLCSQRLRSLFSQR